MRKPPSNFSNAQGTIEYLVILAVIVVISLIVVGLFTGIFSNTSQNVSTSSEKFSTVSGGISIVESVIDVEGDSLIKFTNNSSDSVNLTKISVGNVDNNFNEQIVGLDSKTFSLSGLSSACPCESGQKSVKCEFKIEYTTASGTHTEYRTINVQCVTDSRPTTSSTVVNPITPVLELGTLANPWIINDCLELQDMNNHLDGNYILGEDIDCSDTINWNSGLGFSPIGDCDYACTQNGLTTANFKGSLNGDGHKISGLYINRPSQYYVGLFGYTLNANIENVGLEDANITGQAVVGALIGGTGVNCTINKAYAKGIVTSTQTVVGGLIGHLDRSTIQKSYSTATVNGLEITGGFIGQADSFATINDCYATGDVTGTDQVAGFSARLTASEINNSYSTGLVTGNNMVSGLVASNMVGTATNSYWNTETSGQSSSEVGEGKTTAQMKQQATYQNWNFDTIWTITEDMSYPTLR